MTDARNQLTAKNSDLVNDLQMFKLNKDAKWSIDRIDALRREVDQKEEKITELLHEINKQNNDIDNLLTENRGLRRMAGVSDEFGINIHEIKIRDRELLEE